MRKRINLQQNLINHVGIVYDGSASMGHFASQVITQSEQLIDQLKENSKHFDQETRASMYIFGKDSQPACYDVDVLRTPSLRGLYEATGPSTSLIDAIDLAISDMKQTATIYGDHAFLLYVLTDGQENSSKLSSEKLRRTISTLPDNWTIAALVPDTYGRKYVMDLGFTMENTLIWNTHSQTGIEETTNVIQSSMNTYYTSRSTGMRSVSGLFTPDTSRLSEKTLNTALVPLRDDQYWTFPVDVDKEEIRDAVTRHGGNYVKGTAFFQLTKTEELQEYKQICVMDPKGDVYTGRAARNLLKLPDYRVKVAPAQHPDYTIFIQSTSVNRKLVEGTEVLVLR